MVAEELNSNMVLDVAFLKRVTGGTGVQVGGGDAERHDSLWQAGIVLVFNEGDLPSYDQADLAFRDRLLFAPMRSTFVKALPHQSPAEDKWTFEVDLGVCARFSEWRSALADVLVEHYGVEGGFEQPPHSMTAWCDERTNPAAKRCASNVVVEWLDQSLEVTRDLDDIVLVACLFKEFKVGAPGFIKSSEFCRLCKVHMGSYKVKGVTFKDFDNIGRNDVIEASSRKQTKTARNCIRGVVFKGLRV